MINLVQFSCSVVSDSLWPHGLQQASLSITNSQSLLKLMSIELVMPSNHLILCHPVLLLPSIFPSIRVFSSESVLRIRWPKYWSFSFSISPSNGYSGPISFWIDWLDFLAVQGTLGPFRYDLNQIPYDKPSESESRSVVSDSLWPHGLYSSWDSPGQNTGVGSLSLLQGIVPTQGLNPGLLHCRQMTNLNSVLKRKDITLPTKVYIVKPVVFPLVMYGCKNWTIKKAVHQRIEAFELWCWRRFLRVPQEGGTSKEVKLVNPQGNQP